MNEVDQEAGTVRRQLEGILASSGFAKKDRLSRFLRFVVERKLAGRANELKETVIGFEVFERPARYNPKQDAIVRTEAGRLRSRLGEYYSGEGKTDRLVIELPKGGYVPEFRKADRRCRKPRRGLVVEPDFGLGCAAAIAAS